MERLPLLWRQLDAKRAINFHLVVKFGVDLGFVERELHLLFAEVIALLFDQINVFYFELIHGETV